MFIELPRYYGPLTKADFLFAGRLETIINRNLSSPFFCAARLAGLSDISLSQLDRLVKRVTGVTTGILIRNMRMEIAKGLLADRQIPINSIAFASGFNTHSSFSRSFIKFSGTTPLGYRSGRVKDLPRDLSHKIPMTMEAVMQLYHVCLSNPWLKKLMRKMVTDYLSQNPGTEEMAEFVYMSRATFVRKFKAIIRLAPYELIYRLKLQYAIDLMASANYHVSQAAITAGFYDHSHFCTYLKRLSGKSPSRLLAENPAEFPFLWLKATVMSESV